MVEAQQICAFEINDQNPREKEMRLGPELKSVFLPMLFRLSGN